MPNLPPLKPRLTTDKILKKVLGESQEEARKRWMVIYLLSQAESDDQTRAASIAKEVGYTPQWVRKLVHTYNERGAEAFTVPGAKRGKGGRHKKLTRRDIERLDNYFVRTRCELSYKDVHFFIKSILNKTVHEKTAGRYLRDFKKHKWPKIVEAETHKRLKARMKEEALKDLETLADVTRKSQKGVQSKKEEATLFDKLPPKKRELK